MYNLMLVLDLCSSRVPDFVSIQSVRMWLLMPTETCSAPAQSVGLPRS